jgi:hypothetical protein
MEGQNPHIEITLEQLGELVEFRFFVLLTGSMPEVPEQSVTISDHRVGGVDGPTLARLLRENPSASARFQRTGPGPVVEVIKTSSSDWTWVDG